MNKFILEFLSSNTIQYSTSVIREKFIHEAAKFSNPQKNFTLEILCYTIGWPQLIL